MSRVALAPASPEPGFFDGCDAPLECLRAASAPGDMPEARARGRGDLQGMMILFFIAAQVGRASRPLSLLQPEQVLKETQRFLQIGSQKFDMRQMCYVEDRFIQV